LGRPKLAEKAGVISIRLSLSLIDRLDQYAAKLRLITPGVNVTRTDAARAILVRGLEEVSPGKSPPKPKKGGLK
jgi:hypothetical protein